MVVLTRPPPNAPLPQLGSTMNSPRDTNGGEGIGDSVHNENGLGQEMPGTVTVQVEDAENRQATEVSPDA